MFYPCRALHRPQYMMLASDYPYRIGDLYGCVPANEALPIPGADKELIYGENAQAAFGVG